MICEIYLNKSLKKNPENRTAKKFKENIHQFVDEKLKIQKRGKASNRYLPMDVRINLRFLQVGDIISLALCHGWRSTVIENVPLNYKNDLITLGINSEDGLNYQISPNPFSDKDLRFDIRGKKLHSRKFSSQEELDKAFDNSEDVELTFTISAKEG